MTFQRFGSAAGPAEYLKDISRVPLLSALEEKETGKLVVDCMEAPMGIGTTDVELQERIAV